MYGGAEASTYAVGDKYLYLVGWDDAAVDHMQLLHSRLLHPFSSCHSVHLPLKGTIH